MQLNQLTITSNQQMVHADVQDRKEAVSVRKSSGAFNQLQHPLEIQVGKQRMMNRRTLSAEARPFVALQANKDKVNYLNEEKQRKGQPDSRLRNTVTMGLPDDCSAYKKEEELFAVAEIDQLSVHDRDHLSMTWLMQQNLPTMQIPVFDGSPTKWLEFVVKFKDLVHALQFLTNTQRMTYLLQHLEGEAKSAVQCFLNDKVRYIMALKRLKYMFGQKPQICQAYI